MLRKYLSGLYPEVKLSAPLVDFCLVANYDLTAFTEDETIIILVHLDAALVIPITRFAFPEISDGPATVVIIEKVLASLSVHPT